MLTIALSIADISCDPPINIINFAGDILGNKSISSLNFNRAERALLSNNFFYSGLLIEFSI